METTVLGGHPSKLLPGRVVHMELLRKSGINSKISRIFSEDAMGFSYPLDLKRSALGAA